MLDIQYPRDCGNAPKKKVILDFNIAFANGDVDGILAFLTDNAVWEMVGDRTLAGRNEIRAALQEMSVFKAEKLEVLQIITHGKDASACGVLEFGESRVMFADFYEFTSAGSRQIKRMRSFAHKAASDR